MNAIANTEENISAADRDLTVIQLGMPQSVNMQCRICLQQETHTSMINNPLIIPCKCTGSICFVHQACLRQWIFKKAGTRIHTQLPKCELCNQPYLIKKTCKVQLGWKKRRLDQTVMFIVSVTLTLAIAVLIPALYHLPMHGMIRSIVLGVLGIGLVLLTVITCILFKASFIQIRKEVEVQPYKQIPPPNQLTFQENTQISQFKGALPSKVKISLTTRRSEQPTTAKFSLAHQE